MAQSTSDGGPSVYSATTPAFIPLPVAASTLIYGIRPVAVNASGYGVPVTAASGLRFVGFSQARADNSNGLAGAINVNYSPANGPDAQLYYFGCTGATQAWVGQVVYFVDDQTVALSASNSVICGVVIEFLSATQVLVNTAQRA